MSITLVYSPGICSPVVFPLDDSFSLVSSVLPSSWEIETTVQTQVAVSWKIKQQQITSQSATTWNTEFRVKVNDEGVTPGLMSPVTHPIDWHYTPAGIAWDVDQRRPSQVKMTWRVLNRRSSKKSILFNLRQAIYSFKSTLWFARQRVRVVRFGPDNYNQIDQPVLHPLDQVNNPPIPAVSWNVVARGRKTQAIRWNVCVSRKSQSRILWNTNGILVQVQNAVKWNTFKKVKVSSAIAWAMQSRRPSQPKIKWNVRVSVVSQKAAAFNLRNIIRVIKVLTTNYGLATPVVHPIDAFKTAPPEIQWAVVDRRSSSVEVRYENVVRKNSAQRTTWNLLFRISIPNFESIFYPGVPQPVVHPISLRTYPWGPRIEWNLGITHVVSQKSVSFRTLIKVKTTSRTTWNMNSRIPISGLILFNTLHSVISQDIIEWNVGKAIPEFIRQTSISRQDFAY